MHSFLNVRKIAVLSILCSLAIIISWIEKPLMELIPLPLPGFKLGLANIVTLYALYRLGKKEAAVILLLRISLVSLLFGSPISFILSLSGGVFSFTAAVLLFKIKGFSVYGISAAASAAHMIGQITAASVILSTPGLFLSYFPYLLVISLPTGILNCVLAFLPFGKSQGHLGERCQLYMRLSHRLRKALPRQ